MYKDFYIYYFVKVLFAIEQHIELSSYKIF